MIRTGGLRPSITTRDCVRPRDPVTRALILYAHPCADSFTAAAHGIVCDTLGGRGWEVDDCDLYAEKFSPLLTEEERRGYHQIPDNLIPVADQIVRLRAAQALVLVFPVWNYGYPAILKGYFDRVFLPGLSFRMENGKTVPALGHIRKLAAVTSYGGSRFKSTLAGDPPRRLITRVLNRTCARPKTRYLALYDMNRADEARRSAHLTRLRREMETF
ncbi:NAD(P)H-dependent oxidoreductase [Thioclava sp. BHET1]|nr:NAD(P)H-dependent oxidoreductase [Thioclava sp. BHET1]